MDLTQVVLVIAQEGGSKAQGGGLFTLLLPLVLLGGVFYFLLIRPQQRQRQQHQRVVSEIEPGDEVVTIGGIFGDVVEVDADRITIEVYDGTQIEFMKTAISRRIGPEREEASGEVEDSSDDSDDEIDQQQQSQLGLASGSADEE